MKKIIPVLIATIGFSAFSCKKDRVCECTNTYTSASGNVTTDPMANVTYKDINKRQARDLCQKETRIYVNKNGATSTEVHDCKLK